MHKYVLLENLHGDIFVQRSTKSTSWKFNKFTPTCRKIRV